MIETPYLSTDSAANILFLLTPVTLVLRAIIAGDAA
jgi:hypothetical protein